MSETADSASMLGVPGNNKPLGFHECKDASSGVHEVQENARASARSESGLRFRRDVATSAERNLKDPLPADDCARGVPG